jgi:predicted DNA-binding protein
MAHDAYVATRLDPDARAALKALAMRRGYTVSALVREAIERFIERALTEERIQAMSDEDLRRAQPAASHRPCRRRPRLRGAHRQPGCEGARRCNVARVPD